MTLFEKQRDRKEFPEFFLQNDKCFLSFYRIYNIETILPPWPSSSGGEGGYDDCP